VQSPHPYAQSRKKRVETKVKFLPYPSEDAVWSGGLTTFFISPTAMGLAVLYLTGIDNTGESFATQREAVDNYKRGLLIAGRDRRGYGRSN